MAEKENEIEQYESFDVVNDLFLPIKEQGREIRITNTCKI